MRLIDMIKKNEGSVKDKNNRHVVYKCSAGKMTCGYGRNIEDVGLSEDEVDLMLHNDVAAAMNETKKILPNFLHYDTRRRNALIDMMFNLGSFRFRKFKKMIKAILVEDWATAANEAKNSRWYNQVGQRAIENVNSLRYGDMRKGSK